MNFKILDCTLRDGGYYTNWDFTDEAVDVYLQSMNELPIDYIEVGYRSNPQTGYLGQYFYLPKQVLERIKSSSSKKIVVILNEKDVRATDLDAVIGPCANLIDMVRIAIDPNNLQRALELASGLKKFNVQIGFNVMYMSTWKDRPEMLSILPKVNSVADYFYMVDSYGGVYPEDVKEIYSLISEHLTIPIGFHGHNNLELGLINTLTAIDAGVEIVDATITGMGRGAGNLKTELLLTALHSKLNLDFDYNPLSKVVDVFSALQKEFEWGTNLPYMVSGANSLPQKEVMDWVGKRYYSFNSIIRALHNQSKGVKDNKKLNLFANMEKASSVLIVGGGQSVENHSRGIQQFIKENPSLTVIHASSRNAMMFDSIPNRQIFCLVGNEGHRMEDVFQGAVPSDAICVLPPYPRKMGTYIPSALMDSAYELGSLELSKEPTHTSIALQTAMELGANEVFIVGYDGYGGKTMSQKEQELFMENEAIMVAFQSRNNKLTSLTSTSYSELGVQSLYSLIM